MTQLRFGIIAVCVLGFAVGSASSARAQGVVTQWNFPPGFNLTAPVPSTGSGTAALIGGTTATSAGGLTNGGSSEATAASVAWNTSAYPAASANSGTAGTQYTVSTSGQSDLVFRFDQRLSNTSSRFFQVQYTTDGSTWVPTTTFEGYAGGDTYYNNRTVDLSGVTAANNNANFAVRVVSVFDPANNTSYTGTGGTYGTTGTARFDAVTLSSGFIWSGAGGNAALNTAGNYAGGNAPAATGTVLFGAGGGGNTTVSTATGGTTLDQVVFQAAAPAYTVGGGDTLTLNAGLVNGATAAQTIAAQVTFGQSNAVQNAGTLRFTGAVAFTNFLSLVGSGTTTFNAAVQGTTSALTSGNPLNETVRVAPGQTLAGVGTIGSGANLNDVVVAAGGAVRGGDPNGSAAQRVGALTVTGTTTINSTATTNGILRVEASRNTSTTQTGNLNADSSVLSVTGGNLNLGAGAARFTIDVVSGLDPLQVGEAYTVQLAGVDAAANLLLNGTPIGANVTLSAASYTLTSSSFAFTGVSVFTNASGTALYASFTPTPVPEPGTVLAFAAGVMGLGGYVRRRVRRA